MVLGIIILIMGIIILINELNLGFNIEFSLVWPVALLIFSLISMIKNNKVSFWYTVFAFIGLWYTLYYFDLIKVSLNELLWPAILIILGCAIISNKHTWNKRTKENKNTTGVVKKNGKLNFNGIFGGVEEIISDKDFKGCIANAIFGAVELDLTKIKIKDNVTIDANSIFGGVDLKMPEDYNIVINSFAIFGGNDNKIKREFDESKKTIYINCVSIFGGTEIK